MPLINQIKFVLQRNLEIMNQINMLQRTIFSFLRQEFLFVSCCFVFKESYLVKVKINKVYLKCKWGWSLLILFFSPLFFQVKVG